MAKRLKIVHVRLTDQEYERLQNYADFLGYSRSETLRDQIKKLPIAKNLGGEKK